MLTITRADLRSVIDHCLREYPDEACGILGGRGNRVERIYPMRNIRPGPASYEMDPEEQFRVMKDIRQAGLVLAGIYHSHTGSPAWPSGIDVGQAYWPGTLYPNYPGAVYVIVSLMDRGKPAVKGFLIDEGAVSEVPLTIEDA